MQNLKMNSYLAAISQILQGLDHHPLMIYYSLTTTWTAWQEDPFLFWPYYHKLLILPVRVR